MECILFLYSGSDSAKAEQLKDYLQGKLRKVADLRNITDILAEEQDFKRELSRSSCVVLTGRVMLRHSFKTNAKKPKMILSLSTVKWYMTRSQETKNC